MSLPPAVDERLEREALRRGISVSALVVEALERDGSALPYVGIIEDDRDLSNRVDEVLARHHAG